MPPKGQPLIKGQGSLANYFTRGGITKAQEAKVPASSASTATDSGASSAINGSGKRKKAPEGSEVSKQLTTEVKHFNEKISVRGYMPASVTSSPQKSKAAPVRFKVPEEMPASSKATASGKAGQDSGRSKYFGKGAHAEKAVVVDDNADQDDGTVSKLKRTPSKRAATDGSKRKKTADKGEDGDEDTHASKRTKKASTRKAKGRRSTVVVYDDDEEDSDEPPNKKARAAPTTSKPSASRRSRGTSAKSEDKADAKDNPSLQKRSVGDVSFASEGGAVDDKASLKAARERAAAGPNNPGSKEVPEGSPNCLAGLTFVFTGQLESLAREDAQSLVKSLGAKVTSGPSSKTSYVVLGEGAGPSKLKSIAANRLATLDEDGLLDLIRSRGSREPDTAIKKKLEQEEQKIVKAAKTLEVTGKATASDMNLDMQSLWTVKYAPSKIKDLMGNNSQVELLKNWLSSWSSSLASNFKKPGIKGQNVFRAMLISGPPGIGKTTAAHIVARMCGYTPLELNASDTRSKKLIEDSLENVINNKSLDGWYNSGGTGQMEVEGAPITDHTVLILDEVDGMSGGDRGGIGAINAMIKKTKIPIILIANDRNSQKMRPFHSTTYDLTFRRPKADSIRARLMTIAFREGLKVDKNGMDQLIAASQSDLRSVINMLSTWKLGQKALSFDDSKALGASNVKPSMGNPFSIYSDLASHGTWSASSKKNLNRKADYYFQEPSLTPLFVQENYLRQQPQLAANILNEKEKSLKVMQLMNKAAAAISDGDVIDSMIHGPQQHWSLMPLHAAVSTLKPMSLVYGMGTHGSWGPSFPSWLGNYSKQQRLSRAIVELQVKMRLSAVGSRFEVREQYAPYLFDALSEPLISQKQDGISDVISMMDDYYLGVEDRDILLELGVGKNKGDDVLKKIAKEVKASFTRTYNQQNHPIAFQKGGPGTAKARAKQLRGDGVPDVEEAMVEDEVFDYVSADDMSDDDDGDVGKDKMIKEKKPKGKGKSKSFVASPKKKT